MRCVRLLVIVCMLLLKEFSGMGSSPCLDQELEETILPLSTTEFNQDCGYCSIDIDGVWHPVSYVALPRDKSCSSGTESIFEAHLLSAFRQYLIGYSSRRMILLLERSLYCILLAPCNFRCQVKHLEISNNVCGTKLKPPESRLRHGGRCLPPLARWRRRFC